MLWPTFFLIFVTWILLQLWKKRKANQLWNELKCDIKTVPFIGHGHMFLGSDINRMKSFETFGRQALKYGSTRLQMGSQITVLVDPIDIEVSLKVLLEKDDIVEPAKFITGDGLLFAPVNIWKIRRKILAPIFSLRNLKSFVKIFSEQSSIMVDKLKSIEKPKEIPFWNYVLTYAMDSISETTLGVKVKAQFNSKHPFLEAFDESLKITSLRICQPWFQSDIIFKYIPMYQKSLDYRRTMFSFIENIIEQNRNEIKQKKHLEPECDKESKPKNITLLKLLIESSKNHKYTNVELREETLVIAMAGTDTSAVGTCSTLLALSRNQDVQEKVHKEIEELFGNSDRPVEPEDLPNLKYLDIVIKESLRLYPPVPIITRKVDKDYELPSKIILRKGTAVMAHIWAVHRNTKYWGDDAENFKPERFLNGMPKHPAAFIPFSHGPRNCIGYQYAMFSMKTALINVLRHFKIQSDADKPLNFKYDVMMKDVDGYLFHVEPKSDGIKIIEKYRTLE